MSHLKGGIGGFWRQDGGRTPRVLRTPPSSAGRSLHHPGHKLAPRRSTIEGGVGRSETGWAGAVRKHQWCCVRPGRRCGLGGEDWKPGPPSGCRTVPGLGRWRRGGLRECTSRVEAARGPGPDSGARRAVLSLCGADTSGDPGGPGQAPREEWGWPTAW
ncbi:hypothetical protein NDU88_007243 [Pleurodeles waltl]|uniref:Uncharacterized protein n=1 Tax=Pleurodeles waltl TaxID=8319 RepID=A0AAV7SSB4_PLEWA|nr:hypothetical protein NDU88_007243 [Pleurodeles waltl]